MPVIQTGPRRVVIGVVVAVAALAGAGSASAAAAGAPACGTTLTRSTTLRADLRDCPGDGLVIGADRVTLDLNGHTVDGDAASSGGDDVGVRIEGHQGVTVTDGTVQEFDHAVRLTGADRNRILHVVATHNGDADIGRAILLDGGSDRNRIERNDASFNGRSGVAVLDSSHNVVLRNRTSSNGVAGMGVFGGADNRVIDNVMAGNGENGIFW